MNESRRNSARASAQSRRRRQRVQSGGRAMSKKRGPKKPKIVWVGSTPITPITAKESRKIDKRIRKRHEKLRKRYPEVHGKVVDYISYSIEDGTLFFSVAFKDKTNFSLRFACQMFIVGADFAEMRTGDLEMIREYLKPILR